MDRAYPHSASLVIWGETHHAAPESIAQFAKRLQVFLQSAQIPFPDVRGWTLIGPRETVSIGSASAEIAQALTVACFDQRNLRDYVGLSTTQQLVDASMSRIGFSITATPLTSVGGSAHGLLKFSSQSVPFADHPSARTSIELQGGRSGMALEQCGALMHTLVKSGCRWAGTYRRDIVRAINGGKSESIAGQWLYYFPLPHLGDHLPSDIRWRPFAQGIMIETTPHLPDAGNPDDIAAGKRVSEVLEEFGLITHATYAIEGWPPDREEWAYEEFITGAPSGRKYNVHGIDFDGYDAHRKVLLYAKLFRPLRLQPKQWGLRGWDGPVLNEAKRQVTAARKAGGVPIEWHIGLEEPAARVRQLLADFSSIKQQELTVLYTPIEQMHRK